MVFVEGDEDFAVGGRHDRAVGEGEIDGGIGDAHVVEDRAEFVFGDDGADHIFDAGETVFGFFDAGAGGGADMQAKLAGVNGGEEVVADKGEEEAGADDQEGEGGGGEEAMIEGPFEEAAVEATEFFEEEVEDAVGDLDEAKLGDEPEQPDDEGGKRARAMT